MSVLELEQAISKLPPEELSRFAEWFEEFMADQWDQQIERDVAAGKFDKISISPSLTFGRTTILFPTLFSGWRIKI